MNSDDNVGAAEWSAIECNVAIICASLPSTRAFLSKLLPHIFSTGSNGYRSRTTRPSRTGRSHITGTISNTQVQASVIGGHDRDYDMDKLSPSEASFRASEKYGENKDGFSGIKVTTFVTQESISTPAVQDDAGSTKNLVSKRQDSF